MPGLAVHEQRSVLGHDCRGATALRAARSSQPPRRYEALVPASPTSTLCTRSSGAAGLWLLDGTEAVTRKAECAR